MKYILFLLILASKCTFGQLNVSYFPWHNMLGLTQKFPYNFALDYKLETNSFFNNMNMEFGARRYILINEVIDREDYGKNFNNSICHYGFGIAFNPNNYRSNINTINGYYLDFGVRWSIPKREFLAIVLECSPYVNQGFTNGNLRTRLGLAYRITK